MSDAARHRERLDVALDQVRETLVGILEHEARKAVDATIRSLDLEAKGLSLDVAAVRVQIPPLRLVATDSSLSKRSQTRARQRDRGAGRRGRPDGPVRTALLATFAASNGTALRAEDLLQRLEALGVHTTASNVHQQLRRLTQQEAVERVARGVYRVASTAPST